MALPSTKSESFQGMCRITYNTVRHTLGLEGQNKQKSSWQQQPQWNGLRLHTKGNRETSLRTELDRLKGRAQSRTGKVSMSGDVIQYMTQEKKGEFTKTKRQESQSGWRDSKQLQCRREAAKKCSGERHPRGRSDGSDRKHQYTTSKQRTIG